MADDRAGLNASYVGRERQGALKGDRCHVYADEGLKVHARWLSGQHEGQHSILWAADLAFDQRQDFDPGYSFSEPAPLMNVAAIHQAGGSAAVIETLQAEGLLDMIALDARNAVEACRAAMSCDDVWDVVRQGLSKHEASAIMREVLASALEAALLEDDIEAGNPLLDEGDADGDYPQIR